MKKSLFVTLADKNYLDQAKQLFSSVYWNAGWQGDYMLLAHEVPEKDLTWFRNKGILVKHCAPISRVAPTGSLSLVCLTKFYLFTPEFKKWDTIVYLDADIIVRYSLEALTHVHGFNAVIDKIGWRSLRYQFRFTNSEDESFKKFKESFKPNAPTFNAGVMAFSTDIITENSFERLCQLLTIYHKNAIYHDQPIFNLYFYERWKKLSSVYNVIVPMWIRLLKPEEIDGAVVHFIESKKPWIFDSPFYDEWKNNLEKADAIDLNVTSTGYRIFSGEDMEQRWFSIGVLRVFLIIFEFYYFLDRRIGLLGIFLKKDYPRFYFTLMKVKK
ncbi:MAG: glycosyltransferase [Candidatus Pacebacteria bacterium]|nr:glycosyltransferase [Candidatus Paceibacterota bacterium]MDD5357040.1 glycosyltransferase [Candidatus Paceibacterota bacterium]